MKELGKLAEVTDLRQAWPNEALDFTPWLAREENLERLSDALGVDIQLVEMESDVGNFKADILATEADTGKTVIIENQLEDTDHDHLGKLITYAAGKSAAIVIWVTKRAREEHRAAIEWLNGHTDSDLGFFLCEVKLYTIDNSRPAVKFEVVEKPNDWTKFQKVINMGEGKQLRYDYWTAFYDYALKNEEFARYFKRRKVYGDHWTDLAIGSASCTVTLSMTQQKKRTICVSFYIKDNKALFDEIQAQQEQVEREIGMPLEWKRNNDKKASRIITETEANISDRSSWNTQFEWLTNTVLKFRQVFSTKI